jgi:hypothetical protein
VAVSLDSPRTDRGREGNVSESSASPWADFEFEVGCCRFWRIGPLGFWIRRTAEEWQVAEDDSTAEGLVVAASEPQPPDAAAWSRWAGDPASGAVRLRPVTPDRSIVVRPEQAFRILQGGSARVYVSLPVWVRVELVGEAGPLTMIELATVRLSNTWFGSLFEGELCYWLATSARRTFEERAPRPHIAASPMTIHNVGGEELPLDCVCLHTAHLAIYEGRRGLWTSEVRVGSSSPTDPQRIEISTGPPPEAKEAELRSEPREQQRSGVLARAVGLLQSLPGGA